jgi:hypothetical protein
MRRGEGEKTRESRCVDGKFWGRCEDDVDRKIQQVGSMV